ncbi:hypothetical protein ABZ915_02470 [Streptomyces sp. NPDC046915]|uniref:RraA family protein n=1 Tax=Streptomyces sp. NPDC046915 TaxID=3155257 RepID=UPI0033D7B00E
MTADATLPDRFAALDTATVSDALDACGLPPGQGGLRPMWGTPRVAGYAATVELEPLTGEHGGSHILTDAIAEAGPENVMVVATAAVRTCPPGAASSASARACARSGV